MADCLNVPVATSCATNISAHLFPRTSIKVSNYGVKNSILYQRKLRHREFKGIAQDYTAIKWWGSEFKLSLKICALNH